MLVEIGVTRNGITPELSYGTHFFQDLVESHIYPLALYPEDPGVVFNHTFFQQSPNQLAQLLPDDAGLADNIRVINVAEVAPGKLLRVTMSAEDNVALGYLHTYEETFL
jgi:hypothetical protein